MQTIPKCAVRNFRLSSAEEVVHSLSAKGAGWWTTAASGRRKANTLTQSGPKITAQEFQAKLTAWLGGFVSGWEGWRAEDPEAFPREMSFQDWWGDFFEAVESESVQPEADARALPGCEGAASPVE